MQDPVTNYIGGGRRTLNKKDYDRKLEEDSNLINKEYLCNMAIKYLKI
jgi:hypothetical protein